MLSGEPSPLTAGAKVSNAWFGCYTYLGTLPVQSFARTQLILAKADRVVCPSLGHDNAIG